MLYKKLNLPINLPLVNDEEIEINEIENDIINKIKNSSRINIQSTVKQFEKIFRIFFEKLFQTAHSKIVEIFVEKWIFF